MLLLAVSPSPSNREETLSTLRFGRQAKRIVNKPRVNEDRSPAELLVILRQRDAEIARLRVQVSLAGSLPEECVPALFRPTASLLQLAEAAAGVAPDIDLAVAAATSEATARQDEKISRQAAELAMLRRENAALNEAATKSEMALTALSLEKASLVDQLREASAAAARTPALEAQLAEANRALSELGVHVAGADARTAATAAESAARVADAHRAARDALAFMGAREADLRAALGGIGRLMAAASHGLREAVDAVSGPCVDPSIFSPARPPVAQLPSPMPHEGGVAAGAMVRGDGPRPPLNVALLPSASPKAAALRRTASSVGSPEGPSPLDGAIAKLLEAAQVGDSVPGITALVASHADPVRYLCRCARCSCLGSRPALTNTSTPTTPSLPQMHQGRNWLLSSATSALRKAPVRLLRPVSGVWPR